MLQPVLTHLKSPRSLRAAACTWHQETSGLIGCRPCTCKTCASLCDFICVHLLSTATHRPSAPTICLKVASYTLGLKLLPFVNLQPFDVFRLFHPMFAGLGSLLSCLNLQQHASRKQGSMYAVFNLACSSLCCIQPCSSLLGTDLTNNSSDMTHVT